MAPMELLKPELPGLESRLNQFPFWQRSTIIDETCTDVQKIFLKQQTEFTVPEHKVFSMWKQIAVQLLRTRKLNIFGCLNFDEIAQSPKGYYAIDSDVLQ